jgi:hypothetical protein
MTTISQAMRLSESKHLRYVPGLPITIDYVPITRPQRAASTPLTSPSIYPGPYASHHTISSESINSFVVKAILGGRGTTDFPGLIMIAYFRADPDAWDEVFIRRGAQLAYPKVLARILGVDNKLASDLCNYTDYLFPGVGINDSPAYEQSRDLSPLAFFNKLQDIL